MQAWPGFLNKICVINLVHIRLSSQIGAKSNRPKNESQIGPPKKKEVVNRSTRFKEFNRENKTATKTLNKFKIVPRIGTCDAGVSFSKFRSSCLPFVIKQTTLPVFVAPLESNYGWLKFFPWPHGIRDNESQLYFTAGCNQTSRLDKYILYNYGHIIKLNKQHNKTMIWLGIK